MEIFKLMCSLTSILFKKRENDTTKVQPSCRRKENNRKKGRGWSKLTEVQRLLLLAEYYSKPSGASLDIDTTGCQPVFTKVKLIKVFLLTVFKETKGTRHSV